jgi:DNA-binding NarL/FixJ family response regulator
MTKSVRITIVDDHELFREGIRLVLGQIPEFQVVAEASDGLEFVNSKELHETDVVLMDVEMPGLNGIQATLQALAKNPTLKIIPLTMYSDRGNFTQMIEAGAKGFLLKQASKQDLYEAITTVLRGEIYIHRELQQTEAGSSWGTSSNPSSVSAREIEIIQAICAGQTSKQIADQFGISPKTVEAHRSNIFRKIGVRNISELVLFAIRSHWVKVQ